MDNLMGNEAFISGVNVGIRLYQNVVVEAHERKDALVIGDELYYLLDGRERLEQVLDDLCK